MDGRYIYRAKRADNGEWVEGFYYCMGETTYAFTEDYEGDPVPTHHYILWEQMTDWGLPNRMCQVEVDPSTICRHTGKEYMDGEAAFEGDIFESQCCGMRMALRHGTYEAYCPSDECMMDSVGFYAEAPGYPHMPIGDIGEYALKLGNVFDSPELLGALPALPGGQ